MFIAVIVTTFVTIFSAFTFMFGIHFVHQSFVVSSKDSNLEKTKQSFIRFNLFTVLLFTLAGTTIWMECLLTLLSTPNRFLAKFETDLSLISLIFYLPAKWCLYFILYLRLKLVLKDSQFAYSDKHYFKIRVAIWVSILSGVTAAISSLMTSSKVLILMAFAVGFIFLILDLLIPLWLNIMFIYKFFQIGRFVQSTRKQLSIKVQVSNTANTMTTSTDTKKITDCNNTNINKNSQLSINSETNINIMHNNSESNYNINTDGHVEIAVLTVGSSNNMNSNSNHTSQPVTSQYSHNSNDNLLLQRVSKFAVLSLVIAISSIAFLGALIAQFFIISMKGVDNVPPIGWLTMHTDSCINVVCLVLYFPFANWVVKRCLCICCAQHGGNNRNIQFCCACLLPVHI